MAYQSRPVTRPPPPPRMLTWPPTTSATAAITADLTGEGRAHAWLVRQAQAASCQSVADECQGEGSSGGRHSAACLAWRFVSRR